MINWRVQTKKKPLYSVYLVKFLNLHVKNGLIMYRGFCIIVQICPVIPYIEQTSIEYTTIDGKTR